MKKIILLLGALLVMPNVAYSFTGPAEGSEVHINFLVAMADGGFYIQADKVLCSTAQDRHIAFAYARALPTSFQVSEEGKNQMFALLTAATAAHRNVRVFVDEPPAGVWGCLLGSVTLAD